MTYSEALQAKPEVKAIDFPGDTMTMVVPMEWLETALDALEKAESGQESRTEAEPVRCRDCKHGERSGDVILCSKLVYKKYQVYARMAMGWNHFCAWGERREE